MSKTTKVTNSYFDEALEMSDTESYRQPERAGSHPRGDSPPSAKLSVSEDDYEEGDDEDEYEDEQRMAHRGRGDGFDGAMKNNEPAGAKGNGGGGIGAGGADGGGKFGPGALKSPPIHQADEEEEDPEDDVDPRVAGQFSESGLKEEIKQLLEYIARYSPQEQDLEAELKPFIPDLIPAIGDIDAFIKAMLDLHLRAVSKSGTVVPQVVRSLESANLSKDTKPVDAWIKNIKDLHGKKPPPSVHYSRRMPDIEELMQVWPQELEAAFELYATLIALLLDVPTTSFPTTDKAEPRKLPNMLVESLHVIFTLYSEFKNSVHFKAMERTRTSFVGAQGQP
nr:Intraflagellar transport protein 46 [Polyrhizophydium stewartii]